MPESCGLPTCARPTSARPTSNGIDASLQGAGQYDGGAALITNKTHIPAR